ncbi:MAG: hypothetical protein ACYDH9_16555 [Limisphaerales bacterium]
MRKDTLRSVVGASILAGCVLGGGCAVLTKSQVQEVKAFARAAENYGTLPGQPIRVYASVDRVDRVMIVSARNFSEPDAREKGWEELQKANASSSAFEAIATQTDRALDILNTYAELLITLTSDQFTDSLETGAKALGTSLDQAITRYNEGVRQPKGASPLGLIGGTVAAVVRGGVGVGIRHRQARYLKAYVTAAQPVMGDLTADVRTLMTNEVLTAVNELESRFKDDFKTAAGRRQTMSLDTLESVADAQEQIRRARELCHSAATAAGKFSAAHARLAQDLSHRKTLESHIAEIEALADEIKQAKKLRSELGK